MSHDASLVLPTNPYRVRAVARWALALSFCLVHVQLDHTDDRRVSLTVNQIAAPHGVRLRGPHALALTLGPSQVVWRDQTLHVSTASLQVDFHGFPTESTSSHLTELARPPLAAAKPWLATLRTHLTPLFRAVAKRMAVDLQVREPIDLSLTLHPSLGEVHVQAQNLQIAVRDGWAAFTGLLLVTSREQHMAFDLADFQPRVHLGGQQGNASFQIPTGAGQRRLIGYATLRPSSGALAIDIREEGTPSHAKIDFRNEPELVLNATVHDFPLAVFASLVDRIDLTTTRITGHVEVARARDSSGLVVRANQTTIGGLVVHDPRLAAQPLAFEPLGLTLNVTQNRQELRAKMEMRYQGVRFFANFVQDDDELAFDLDVPTISCQALLDALPGPFVPRLAGMQVEGAVAGSVHAQVNRTALTAFANFEREEPGSENPPGRLEIDLPLRKACTIRTAPTVLDLAALQRGNYVHRFADGHNLIERGLARHGPGFVALPQSGFMAQSAILLEDALFWQHDGFDREQMQRAWWLNLAASHFARGASTISQQVARMLWLGTERTLSRKVQELALTALLEDQLEKKRILELYLNLLELGPGIYGIGDGARYYFGKEPHELSWRQALHLAALAPAPVRYAERFAHGDIDAAWRTNLDEQLDRLVLHGVISRAVAEKNRHSDLALRKRPRPNVQRE